MSTSSTPILSPLAYTVPLLHAAKYHSQTVIGVLLASPQSTSAPHFVDAIPLLHHYTSLSPMAEAALDLSEVEAKGRGLSIAGVYVAHAAEETGLGRVAERILEGIKKSSPGAVGLSIDSSRLGAGGVPYILWDGKKKSGDVQVENKDAVAVALSLIRQDGLQGSLVDFDDHLEDSAKDWVGNEEAKKAVLRRFV